MAAVLLGACGGTNVKPIAAEDLQRRIAQSVEDQLGQAPAVLCPGSLEAKVGASATCSISGADEPLIATAKVTSVNTSSGDVKISVSVAPEEATPSPSSTEKAPGESVSPSS